MNIDAEFWPGIANRPHSPFRAAVAKWLLRRIVTRVHVRAQLPDGSIIGDGAPLMVIHDEVFFHRLGADLKIGLGESYMAGDWSAGPDTDLADLLTPFAARLLDIVPAWLRRFRRLIEQTHPHHEENHRKGAKRNIERHYDLSNDLFSCFLDDTMTYSSAWFDGLPRNFASLAQAQRQKVDGILDFARVDQATRVLEIGSGWGQLSLQAADRGAAVHTITLSEQQKLLAETRFAAAKLSDRINIEIRDYRDAVGEYDAVVSVEMIEAVGAKYWPEYFQVAHDRLRPEGWFGLQAITMPHDRMLASKHAYTWVHKYIFPGGLIPSVEAIEECCDVSGLKIVDRRELGLDYASTLRIWRQQFIENWPAVNALGFDEVFRKMWEFYLAYSEAGFASGHLNVWQFGIQRIS